MYTSLLALKLVLALVILAVGQSVATPTPTPLTNNSTILPPTVPHINSTVSTRTRLHSSAAATPIPFNATSPDARRRRGGNTEGRYYGLFGEGCIYNSDTRRCLDVEQSRKNWQSADAQMWMCNGNQAAQFFEIWQDEYGGHKVVSPPLGGRQSYCLDVAGSNAFQGQVVRWWDCNKSLAQSWIFTMDGNGNVISQMSPNEHGDLCLDPAGGGAGNRNGQPMQLWGCLPRPYNDIQVFRMTAFRSGKCKIGGW